MSFRLKAGLALLVVLLILVVIKKDQHPQQENTPNIPTQSSAPADTGSQFKFNIP